MVNRVEQELNSELNMTTLVVTHNAALAACMEKSVTIVEGQIENGYQEGGAGYH